MLLMFRDITLLSNYKHHILIWIIGYSCLSIINQFIINSKVYQTYNKMNIKNRDGQNSFLLLFYKVLKKLLCDNSCKK